MLAIYVLLEMLFSSYLNFFKPDREHTLSLDYNRDQTFRHPVNLNWITNKLASDTKCLVHSPVVKV